MSGLRALRQIEWNDDPLAVDLRDETERVRHCFKSSGGGNTTHTTVQSNDLPAYLKPYYVSGLEAAEADVLNRPTEFYGGQTFTDFSPDTETALSQTAARATGGSPLLDEAQRATRARCSQDASYRQRATLLCRESPTRFGRR